MGIPEWRVEALQIIEELERERAKWERLLEVEPVKLNLDGLHQIINFDVVMKELNLPPSRRNIEYLEEMLQRFYRDVIKSLGIRGKTLPKTLAKRFQDLFIDYVNWARYNRYLRFGRSKKKVRRPRTTPEQVRIIPEFLFEEEE